MVATLVDFSGDAEVDLPIAGHAGAPPTPTAAELTNRFRAQFQTGATNVASHSAADTTQHVGDNTTTTSVAQRLKTLLVRGKVIRRRVAHHHGVAAFRQRLIGHSSAAALPDQALLRVEYGKPCFTPHENPSLAFPLHRVEYRSKPMPHSTRKPVDHDTDIYYLYNHVSSGNSSVATKVLATLTCEVIVQQLTTHNKHQFHDSQSSSHHTIQTLQYRY
eukprot:COSAG01_NODE_1520_length_10029_cov_26.551374_7_plen_218_part_00